MEVYANKSGNSSITGYKIDEINKKIYIEFSEKTYLYYANVIGYDNYEKMKELAFKGSGLCSYINTHPEVKNNYQK